VLEAIKTVLSFTNTLLISYLRLSRIWVGFVDQLNAYRLKQGVPAASSGVSDCELRN